MDKTEVFFGRVESRRLDSLKRGLKKSRLSFLMVSSLYQNCLEGKNFFYQQEVVSVGGQQICTEASVAVLNATLALVDPQMTVEQMSLLLWRDEMSRRKDSPDVPSLLEEYTGDALIRISPAGIAQLFEISRRKHLAMEQNGYRMHQVKLPIIPFRFSNPE